MFYIANGSSVKADHFGKNTYFKLCADSLKKYLDEKKYFKSNDKKLNCQKCKLKTKAKIRSVQ